MSEENVEVVRRAYEVFDTDLDALLRLLDPAIEWISSSDAIEPGLRRGHKGVRDAFAATAMAWDEPTRTPEDFIDANDKVLVTAGYGSAGLTASAELYDPLADTWTAAGLLSTVPFSSVATTA